MYVLVSTRSNSASFLAVLSPRPLCVAHSFSNPLECVARAIIDNESFHGEQHTTAKDLLCTVAVSAGGLSQFCPSRRLLSPRLFDS